MYLPLAEWYADKGRGLFRHELVLGPDSKKAAARAGVSQERYAEVLKERIETYYEELNTLVRFSSALSGHTLGLSMREFVVLANEAFEVLAINSDLTDYPRWEAHDPNLPDYLPEHPLNLEEMLEGDSRLLEHQLLRQAGATEAHWATWKSIWKEGRYAVAYDWLLAELGSPEIARVAIEIALTTPIDLICKDALNGGLIYVEDCLPNWRLKRVVEALKQSAWPLERSDAERAAKRDIARRAGIPAPGRTLMAMRGKKLTGKHAWGTDTKLRGIPLESTPMEYFEYCEEELIRGLNMRSKDFLAFSSPEGGHIFQPAMEFYADTVLCNGAPGSQYDLKFYLKVLLMLTGHKMLLEIFLARGDLTIVERLEASFLKRLAESGINAESAGWPGVRQLLEQTVGPEISNLLQW